MEFNLLMHHIEIFPHHTKKKKKQILIREAQENQEETSMLS